MQGNKIINMRIIFWDINQTISIDSVKVNETVKKEVVSIDIL